MLRTCYGWHRHPIGIPSKIMILKPIRRTFAAKRATSEEERQRLNLDAHTSEYMTGSPWLVRQPFTMDDGTPHPRQPFLNHTFRTKGAAEAWISEHQTPLSLPADSLFIS